MEGVEIRNRRHVIKAGTDYKEVTPIKESNGKSESDLDLNIGKDKGQQTNTLHSGHRATVEKGKEKVDIETDDLQFIHTYRY